MSDTDYRLGLLKVPVSDITRSAEFYRDVLGLEEQFVAEEYGWAQMMAGDLPLALYMPGMGGGDGRVGGVTGFHLSLPTERFTVLAVDLQSRGVLVGGMVLYGADDSVFIDVIDPDGNIIKILMRLDP